MITTPLKAGFESVLREQQLADIAGIVSNLDLCDEVPLYSRYQQIDFLKQHGDVDLLLMEFSLDYLNRVTSETPVTSTERFAAITIISDDADGCIVPAIFVCNRDAKRQLKNLRLKCPSTALGHRVEQLMKQINPDAGFVVLEDQTTVPGAPREFIALSPPPAGFVCLWDFCESSCQP